MVREEMKVFSLFHFVSSASSDGSVQVYNRCQSSDEKILLLSNLLIRRGAGVTSTTRRVGPELSKRVYLTMNSCSPEQVLESNP